MNSTKLSTAKVDTKAEQYQAQLLAFAAGVMFTMALMNLPNF